MEKDVISSFNWSGRWVIDWMYGSEWFQSLPFWVQAIISILPATLFVSFFIWLNIREKNMMKRSD